MIGMRQRNLLVFLALLCVVSLPTDARLQTTSLRFTVPAGWLEEERSSSMQVAQYRLPKVAPDTEDASLVLYYFGENQGGSAAANVERWVDQMKQADGGSSQETAKTDHLETNGLQVTTVDVSGTYVAETAPGSGKLHNQPGYRLRAAVIETPKGSYYVKLVGPEKTVAEWNDSFLSFIKSFQFK